VMDCGDCGAACNLDHASARCAGGFCAILMCDLGYADCDGLAANGCEVPLGTLTDCGSCGASCAVPNASEACVDGACEIVACDPGWGDCNATDADGCETSLDALTSCGACTQSCDLAHAADTCAGGICDIAGCDPGWGNCDGVSANGCEEGLSSLEHCG